MIALLLSYRNVQMHDIRSRTLEETYYGSQGFRKRKTSAKDGQKRVGIDLHYLVPKNARFINNICYLMEEGNVQREYLDVPYVQPFNPFFVKIADSLCSREVIEKSADRSHLEDNNKHERIY
jgi:hypothetical protein